MGLENLRGAVFIDSLDETNPVHASDQIPELDNHLRGIKNVLRRTFPNLAGAVLRTHTQVNEAFITGRIEFYAGSSEPSGWAFCNGQTLSRTGQSELFALIGTTFGDGDGSTTFNVPDLQSRVAAMVGGGLELSLGETTGANTHVLTTDELGEHSHELDLETSEQGEHRHPFTHRGRRDFGHNEPHLKLFTERTSQTTPYDLPVEPAGEHTHSVMGDTQTTGGGGGHNNIAPGLGVNAMIKL